MGQTGTLDTAEPKRCSTVAPAPVAPDQPLSSPDQPAGCSAVSLPVACLAMPDVCAFMLCRNPLLRQSGHSDVHLGTRSHQTIDWSVNSHLRVRRQAARCSADLKMSKRI